MNWQHLVYFKVTAETQNFSRASEQLYITPSALSKAINSLEQELNFPLFEKAGRNSILTDYGRTFKTYVDQALDCIDQGLAKVQEQLDICGGKVNICGIYTMCGDYLPPRIKQFLEIYPQVTFSMVYQITLTVLESILSGTADLGFCGDFDPDDKRFAEIERVEIKTEELVIITPPDHPLASDTFVDLDKLREERFITYRNVNSGIHQIFTRLCECNNIHPHIAFEAPDDHTIIGLVAAGLGISLLANNPSLKTDNVHVLKFTREEALYRKQYMIWRKGHYLSSAVRAFRDYILDEIPDSL